ncbi:MAG TPA: PilC/PilY family type IV pilus protein [Candidatus Binatia bacterium]|nr:PilC/PilY family type IV pilus protein [Candidatus Binatia bacterium]
MKKTIAILQVLSILLWNSWNLKLALADDSDIFGTNIEPNVMILFDSSGSMDEEIFSHPYEAATTYSTPAPYTGTKVYRKYTTKSDCGSLPRPCYKEYAATISAVSNSSARSALSTNGYWTGRIGGSTVDLFYGNYLNYLACTTCSIQEKKIVIAKRVVTNVINNTNGVRFGVMKFANNSTQGSGGGGMVATIGTAKSTMTTAINNITPSGFTPLGEQLSDAGRYYRGATLRNGTTFSSPIQYACQPNFVILMTDGLQNGSLDVSDIASNRYNNDHASWFSGMQNVIVHTIGFALPPGDQAASNAELQQTATNGGGNFFSTNDSAQLERALQDAISQILAATFSFATPVVPTTGTSGVARAYLASFQSNPTRPFWRGYLKAYNRDADGLIQVDANGIPLVSALAWDAGEQLSTKSAASRSIYTLVGGTRRDFTNSYVTAGLLGAADSTERDKIIDFTRGIDRYDEDNDNNTSEARPWKLGDIFHSTPVLVRPPFAVSTDASYLTFKTANASRTAVLLAGSNDGMLHAFRESDGAELWGFIPPDQLDDLKDLTAISAQHDFLVDGSPIAADVKIGATPTWKTIAIFGLRRGGKSYYALDVTDTTNPLYLWSFTDSKLGETWSEPVIGRIKLTDGTSKYVAFLGGGYDTPSNNSSGKAFYVIDLTDGTKLWEYYNPGSVSDDRQYMNFSLAAAPRAVDLNSDGHVDRVYIGDVGGQLWKFDFSAPATISGGVITNWNAAERGKRFFVGAPSQANPPPTGEYYPAQGIYTPPAVALDAAKNLWVYFGTGDRNHPNNTSSNRFYAIKDNTEVNGAALMTQDSYFQESSLTNTTSGSGNVNQGFYIALSANEKVLSSADAFASVVFFTTFTPTTATVCGGGGGDAKLYAVNLTTGDAALDLTTGGVLPSGTAAAAAARNIGTGIPSRPIVTIDQNGNIGNPYIITGTTNQQVTNTPVPALSTRRLVGWREVF